LNRTIDYKMIYKNRPAAIYVKQSAFTGRALHARVARQPSLAAGIFSLF